jgi:hypothetical protein
LLINNEFVNAWNGSHGGCPGPRCWIRSIDIFLREFISSKYRAM